MRQQKANPSIHVVQISDVKMNTYRNDRTDIPGQTVQTQISLLLDQGLHCLPFRLHRLDSLLYGSSNFRVITTKIQGVRIFRKFTVRLVRMPI